jgi:hypothetical protein
VPANSRFLARLAERSSASDFARNDNQVVESHFSQRTREMGHPVARRGRGNREYKSHCGLSRRIPP